MSNHTTIAALKARLESERKTLADKYDVESPKHFHRGIEGTAWAHHDFKTGHEAATERLMGLLEKAVEMAEFYGNASTYYLKYRGVQVGLATIYGGTEIPTTEAFHEKGKKAREFLTTLADELKKEKLK